MNLIIKTESETFTARELWSDSRDSFIEGKLDEIESSDDGRLDDKALLACYRHFSDVYGGAEPLLREVSEDGKTVRIMFPEDEDWEIECYLQ